jgi:P4 family phage/plasmid primase-like protien
MSENDEYLKELHRCLRFLTNKLGNETYLTPLSNMYLTEILDPGFINKLDSDIYSLPLKGGLIINLKTKEIRERVKTDYFTTEVQVPYDPHCNMEKFMTFIHNIMLDKQDLIDYLQIILGSCITGNISLRKLIVFYGPSSGNGKSTLIQLMSEILGEKYLVTMPPNALKMNYQPNPDTATPSLSILKGARVAIRHEVSNKVILDDDLIKMFTGGDLITARGLYAGYFTFKPTFNPIITCTTLPICDLSNQAMKDRVELIPFNCRFVEVISNPEYERLLDHNFMENSSNDQIMLSALLNWMIEGCYKFLHNDYTIPDTVKIITEEYQIEQDTCFKFINEKLELPPIEILQQIPGSNGDTNARQIPSGWYIASTALFNIYLDWCTQTRQQNENHNQFGKEMSKHLQWRFTRTKTKWYICRVIISSL